MSELDDLVTPEVVMDDKAAKVREANRLRKQAQRAREKEERLAEKAEEARKAELAKLKECATPMDFWLIQRQSLKPEELKELTSVSEDMWEFHEVLSDYVDGAQTRDEDLLDTIREFRDAMKKPLAPITFTVQEKFWVTEMFTALCSRDPETNTFLRYGLLASLPDTQVVHEFARRFAPDVYVPAQPDRVLYKPSDRVDWESVECVKCPPKLRHLSRRAVPVGMYDAKHPFICHVCISQDKPWRQHKAQQIDGSTILDEFGRIKT